MDESAFLQGIVSCLSLNAGQYRQQKMVELCHSTTKFYTALKECALIVSDVL